MANYRQISKFMLTMEFCKFNDIFALTRGKIWHGLGIYDYEQVYMAKYGYILVYVYGYIWVYMCIYGYIPYKMLLQYFQMYITVL